MDKFKCNGCSRVTEFIWLDKTDTPKGFRVYQCLACGCTGTKNLAAIVNNDAKVKRCDQCGDWQFDGKDCHTCLLIDSK